MLGKFFFMGFWWPKVPLFDTLALNSCSFSPTLSNFEKQKVFSCDVGVTELYSTGLNIDYDGLKSAKSSLTSLPKHFLVIKKFSEFIYLLKKRHVTHTKIFCFPQQMNSTNQLSFLHQKGRTLITSRKTVLKCKEDFFTFICGLFGYCAF